MEGIRHDNMKELLAKRAIRLENLSKDVTTESFNDICKTRKRDIAFIAANRSCDTATIIHTLEAIIFKEGSKAIPTNAILLKVIEGLVLSAKMDIELEHLVGNIKDIACATTEYLHLSKDAE